MLRYAIFFVFPAILFSCSISNRIIDQTAIAYEYDNGKVLGGDYIEENRAFVLKNIPRDFLKDFDSLILIENVISIQDYYGCAVFSDSMAYFYQAKGLENPKQIDLKTNPLVKPALALYIYNKIKQGDLVDILTQGEKPHYVHPSSLFLTIIKKDGRNLNVSGYDLHEFVPKERQMELDSIKDEINRR